MTEPVFHEYESREALGATLADAAAAQLEAGVRERGRAFLVVSGGSTPKPFFAALRAKALPWEKIAVSLADERWVPASHDDSSEKLLREHLLRPQSAFLSMAPREGESLHEGAARLNEALERLNLTPDVCVLGMGEDAHTASLFPAHPALEQGLDKNSKALCVAVEDSPKPPPERISLTAALLCRSRLLALHITGDDKREIYTRAMQDASLPITSILAQNGSAPHICWAK